MIRLLQTAGLAALASVATLLAAELGFRVIGYDFSGVRAAWAAHPIYYRFPTEPVGPVFFHRRGPDTWVGNVLSQGFRAQWRDEAGADPYADEPAITVHYDRDGFRNPDDLGAWEIAVVGDSFTELGYLAYEDLFTTQLAQRLGLRVKNLGVSYSGPLAHRFYLERYGASPVLEHAILVFFEGNDLADLADERAALRRWRESGTRPERVIGPQTSLLRFLQQRLTARSPSPMRPSWARFLESHGARFRSETTEIPVTLTYTPSGRDDVRALQGLADALGDFAAIAGRLGATPWLVYLPCKRRILDGRLRFGAGADPDLVAWSPTDLPDYVREVAAERGLRFVDLTPAFAAEAAQGRLLYNGLWDSHFNRAGSHLAGRLIADALLAPARSPSGPRLPAQKSRQRAAGVASTN